MNAVAEKYVKATMLNLLLLSLLLQSARAQNLLERLEVLPEDRFKSGDLTLTAFTPVARATRYSIVKLDVDGNTVALAAVVDTNGLALTKASEIKKGKLTCWLAGGKEVAAELIAKDEDNDVALVKVSAAGLRPIEWSSQVPSVGQWVVTPGIEQTPQAVGILSVPPRKILHPRALIGVQLDFSTTAAKIGQIMAGLGAEKAGLKPGDVVLSVNNTPVKSRDELINTLRNFRDGQSVKLRVQRADEELEMSVLMMVPKLDRAALLFDRQERMNRLGGNLSERAEGFELAIQHDTVLQPWQCGGPLVNLDGKAFGLNIARAGRVASYALPADLVKQIFEKLREQAQPKPARSASRSDSGN
jgi:serine protease Do